MKPNIFYLDDESENLRAFRGVFRREYEIYLTESPSDGLEYLKHNLVDIIITDQRMPEMSGVSFLKKVFELLPNIPPGRIILSGFSEEVEIQEAKEKYGLSRFISKPWDADELRGVIDSIITQSS